MEYTVYQLMGKICEGVTNEMLLIHIHSKYIVVLAMKCIRD